MNFKYIFHIVLPLKVVTFKSQGTGQVPTKTEHVCRGKEGSPAGLGQATQELWGHVEPGGGG